MNSPSSIVCSDKKNFYFHILIALKVDFENDKNDFDKNDKLETSIQLSIFLYILSPVAVQQVPVSSSSSASALPSYS